MLLFSWPILKARSKWGMQFIFLSSSEDFIQNPEMLFRRGNNILSGSHRQKRSRVIILSGDVQKPKPVMAKNSLKMAKM